MTTALLQIELDETELPKAQIEQRLRALIASGKIAPRTRLPSTRELAKKWRVPASTVHLALAALVKDGLLVRHHGSGTYVRQRAAKLTRVAIYFVQDVDSTADAPFLQANLRALRAVLAAKGIESDVWVDPRPRTEQATAWPELARAARERRIQAIVLPAAHWDLLRWVTKLPVPTALVGSALLPNTVHVDLGQLVEISLAALARQGCRSLGVISGLRPDAGHPDGQPHDHYRFFESLIERAGQLGLVIRDKWIQAQRHHLADSGAAETFGYGALQDLWRRPDRPAGLLVYPHSVARGVVTGLLEAQARVPQELKLVLHKNAGVELFCPVPATLAVSDEREMAEKLVAMVEKQFRGEPVESARWSIRLAEHRGAAGRPAGR